MALGDLAQNVSGFRDVGIARLSNKNSRKRKGTKQKESSINHGHFLCFVEFLFCERNAQRSPRAATDNALHIVSIYQMN